MHVLPDPGGSSSSAVSRDESGEGSFSDFSQSFFKKKESPKSAGSPSAELVAERSAHGRRRLMRLIMSGVVEMLFEDPSQDRVPQLFLEVLKVFSLDRAQHVE